MSFPLQHMISDSYLVRFRLKLPGSTPDTTPGSVLTIHQLSQKLQQHEKPQQWCAYVLSTTHDSRLNLSRCVKE